MLMNASILLPLPADLIVFSAGAMANHSWFFNPITIGIVAGIAASIGEMTAWAVGWGTKRFLLKKEEGKLYKTIALYFHKFGFWGVAFLSVIPFPHDFVGLFAGAVHYDPVKFFVATLMGKIPRCMLLASAGYAGATIVLSFFSWF